MYSFFKGYGFATNPNNSELANSGPVLEPGLYHVKAIMSASAAGKFKVSKFNTAGAQDNNQQQIFYLPANGSFEMDFFVEMLRNESVQVTAYGALTGDFCASISGVKVR